MNDITALMGKLKANIAYLQFDEAGAQERAPWPMMQRLTRAQDRDGEAATAAEASGESLAEAGTPTVPDASAATAGRSLLKRYAPPESVAEGPLPPSDSRALADIFTRLSRKPR